MRAHVLAAAGAAAFLSALAGCGTSGNGIGPRPVETLIYVHAGGMFEFVETPDPMCPGFGDSNGTGIEAPNASHQFVVNGQNRVFQAPHLFVLENIRQPVQAVIRNLSTQPLEVDVFLGVVPRVSGADEGLIQPGECRAVTTDRDAPLDPDPRGVQTQVEVCSPIDSDDEPNLSISCLESNADRSIAFRASIGDVRNSNLTNCIITPFLDACRSPATFFLEQPTESVDAVMNVNSGQNPGNQPTAQVRGELYLNGLNVANEIGTQVVVSGNL